jgi:tripartite-type tricarboxylate transporter receptor subunit TctC
MKGFEFVSWYGLWGPRGLPDDVTQFLHGHIAKILTLPDVRQRLDKLGFNAIGSGGTEFGRYIDVEMARYAKIIKDSHIGVQEQK